MVSVSNAVGPVGQMRTIRSASRVHGDLLVKMESNLPVLILHGVSLTRMFVPGAPQDSLVSTGREWNVELVLYLDLTSHTAVRVQSDPMHRCPLDRA